MPQPPGKSANSELGLSSALLLLQKILPKTPRTGHAAINTHCDKVFKHYIKEYFNIIKILLDKLSLVLYIIIET